MAEGVSGRPGVGSNPVWGAQTFHRKRIQNGMKTEKKERSGRTGGTLRGLALPEQAMAVKMLPRPGQETE